MALTQIQQGMLVDGILTADTAGRLKMADAFVNAAKLASGAARSNFGAGAVLQVVSATKTDTFSSASYNTWVDVTGLSVSITPASTSNKILVVTNVVYGGTSLSTGLTLRCLRGATAIGSGDAAGSRSTGFGGTEEIGNVGIYQTYAAPLIHLDSPSTTSSTTYKIQLLLNDNYPTAVINRTGYDSDALQMPRLSSSITVLEIAG
jgi:hypothetical protein